MVKRITPYTYDASWIATNNREGNSLMQPRRFTMMSRLYRKTLSDRSHDLLIWYSYPAALWSRLQKTHIVTRPLWRVLFTLLLFCMTKYWSSSDSGILVRACFEGVWACCVPVLSDWEHSYRIRTLATPYHAPFSQLEIFSSLSIIMLGFHGIFCFYGGVALHNIIIWKRQGSQSLVVRLLLYQ